MKYAPAKISKILNNNAVEILIKGEPFIVLGTGVGFQRHAGETIALDGSQRIYALLNRVVRNRFWTLAQEIPYDCFELTQQIIDMAETRLHTTFNTSLLLSLADHIYFAAQNRLQGRPGAGFESEELKRLYREEFDVALDALAMVEKHYGIEFERKEATSIAFLLVGAEYHVDGEKITRIQNAIKSITAIIDEELDCAVENDPVRSARLLIHLKFFLQRVVNNEPEEDGGFTGISISTSGETEQKIERIITRIDAYMQREFSYSLSATERLYLLIHLARIL